FVGGGFGPKIMMFYPEEVLVPWAALRLGRPVKWTEDRQENFFATTQQRAQLDDAELAVPHARRNLGVRDACLHDTRPHDPTRSSSRSRPPSRTVAVTTGPRSTRRSA